MEPLLLIDGQGEYPLGLHLEILEDPTGELIIEDVHSPGFYSLFIPSQNVYCATKIIGDSALTALEDARQWLESPK